MKRKFIPCKNIVYAEYIEDGEGFTRYPMYKLRNGEVVGILGM